MNIYNILLQNLLPQTSHLHYALLMKDSFPAGRVREGDRQWLQGRQGDREDTQPVPAALQGGARPRRHPELPPEGGLRHERRVGPLAANTGRMNNWLTSAV